MRYQNWDVLLFPKHSKIPLQEFRTDCHVIQDPEPHSSQANPHPLPIVTCFIPGLHADAAFYVSIHSWEQPQISRYMRNMARYSDIIRFETRAFIDGKLVGSQLFPQDVIWPTIIDLSMDMDKNGEFMKLKFPTFHKELLSQSYWNAGDDLGRIKVIIAEGFYRDDMIHPFERVKNLVCFSFQHAPLEVLEASSIAWPNTAMWRQVSLLGPYWAQQSSPRRTNDGVESHTHSPNRKSHCSQSYDPFIDLGRSQPLRWRQSSAADVSMPDYSNSNTGTNSSRHVTDPMSISELSDHRLGPLHLPGAYDTICEALMPSVPVNTPQNERTPVKALSGAAMVTIPPAQNSMPETESAVTPASRHDNLNAGPDSSPAIAVRSSEIGGIKSRKENMQDSPRGAEVTVVASAIESRSYKVSQPLCENSPNCPRGFEADFNGSEGSRKMPQSVLSEIVSESPRGIEADLPGSGGSVRKASQSYLASNSGGKKRQRVVSSAASKVIDDEDEPRSSPSLRKVSGLSLKQGTKDGERQVLGGIENV